VTDTVGVLRRIVNQRPSEQRGERCEMCVVPIGEEHSHVVDLRQRSLKCTCRPCALLFDRPDADLAFRTVPTRYLRFDAFAMSLGQWDDLAIPVGVAFFFRHSSLERMVAFYPSPAGATESELSLDAWSGVVEANPALATLEPDVEAILLRRDGNDVECYLVPIDACYELVGQLRTHWHGFDGGRDVHTRLDAFFTDVASRSKPA
jgi:hypothetical protein